MLTADTIIKAQSYLTFDPNFLDPAQPTGLWLCETAEDVYAVNINAVKLAEGARWGDLRSCESFFRAFYYVFVAIPDPVRRQKTVEALRQVLPELSIYVPGEHAFRGCRSLAEFREQFGLDRVQELLLDARELPVYGLVNLADIEPMRMSDLERTTSGIPELDRYTGGFFAGQLSLWTGERGKGKSTLLGQLLLEAIDQDKTVCAYSGELDKRQFKQWVSVQAAGPDHVGVYEDRETGRKMTAIAATVQKRIDEWWDRRFFLYDVGTASSHSEDSILRTFDNAHRCYGAAVFLVDNIMTVGLSRSRDGDYFRAQSNFAGRLVQFAKSRGVHVHLVAHPRKADAGRKRLSSDDVGGSGDLTNRADNVFALEAGQRDAGGKLAQVTVLSCLKNRMFGGTKQVKLFFDVKSKRFYLPEQAPNRKYGWELAGSQINIQELPQEGTPFEEVHTHEGDCN